MISLPGAGSQSSGAPGHMIKHTSPAKVTPHSKLAAYGTFLRLACLNRVKSKGESRMNGKRIISGIIAGGFLLGGIATAAAQTTPREIRRDVRELRRDNREVRREGRELRRDRVELRRDIWSGAPYCKIRQDRREIRRDARELRRDLADRRFDRRELRRDLLRW